MLDPKQDDFLGAGDLDREGAFDAQLSLPLPFLAPPAPFQTVLKRDGRHEPFRKRKIAEAIFKAAQSVGGQDRDLADSLASAVTIFLMKRLNGQAPTVDHIHDAVERVLIQMAHAKTALAYARYRDRRGRIRRLRQGDMRQLLSELEEARTEREAMGGEPGKLLAVHASGDELTQWDRGRIVRALERETGIEPAVAEVIAIEVEQQIERAHIRTLTSSLIRELVDAKLIEHGLEEYREKHRRLGVPLFDAERIIRGTSGETVARDPVATDQALARAVKKEYGLAQVFSLPVAEAHLCGDLHIHHLDRVDRLFSAVQSPESIIRSGMGLPGSPDFAVPPNHPQTLLAQLVKSSALLQGYFSEPMAWEAVNVYMAPFLAGMDRPELKQFAQMLVYEFAYQSLRSGGEMADAEIGVCWDIPVPLTAREAFGPRGLPLGKPYGAFAHTAQQFAWALIETIREGGVHGVTLPAPVLVVRIGPEFFRSDGHDTFLEHAAGAAAEGRRVAFDFSRETAIVPSSNALLHQISLNLPRAAYITGTEAKLMEGLKTLVARAVSAHAEKRDFLEGLLDEQGLRPLGLLSRRRNGQEGIDLYQASSLVAVDGLNECVQVLSGNRQLHETEDARALGERLLDFLAREVREQGERSGLNVALAQNNDPRVSQRFATLDAHAYPKTAATTIKTDEYEQLLRYTAGVRLYGHHGLAPMDAARHEGRFHAHLESGACSEMVLTTTDLSPRSMADFLKKVHEQTTNQRIVFRG